MPKTNWKVYICILIEFSFTTLIAFFEICTLFSDIRTFSFRIINYPKNSKVFQKFFFWNCKLFQKFLELQTIQKKITIWKKIKSGAAGTRTHGRGSVPLMSKSYAIPLRHEAETFEMGFYYEFIWYIGFMEYYIIQKIKHKIRIPDSSGYRIVPDTG